jgi:tetratricopeptide (TPR) repeat protein
MSMALPATEALSWTSAMKADAIRSILRDLLAVSANVDALPLRSGAHNLIANGIVAEDLEASLNDLLNLTQPERLLTIYSAMDIDERARARGTVLAQIMGWAASKRPLFLIVEAVHWASPPVLGMLTQIAIAIKELPVILLSTSRIDGDPIDRTWRASIAGTYLSTMDMAPLRQAEARKLCDGILVDSNLVETLISRADGNPLFLEQLLRHTSNVDDRAVPGTIQSLVQAALDQLSPADKRTIQSASVIGQRFNMELIRELTENEEITPTQLVQRNLLRPQGEEYLFAHALIREAVNASLLSATRKGLHSRAAAWYADRDLSLHAEHLALAGEVEAAAAFLTAASEKLRKFHYQVALALIRRSVEIAQTSDQKAKLFLLEGDTYLDLGQMVEAERSYELVLSLVSVPLDRCRALIGLAGIKRITDQLEEALVHLQEAQSIAEAPHQPEELSRVHSLRGNLLFPRGEFEACFAEHQESLRLAREAMRPELEAMALGGLGDAEYMRGRMASARTRLSECVGLATKHHLGRVEVANQAQVAHTLIYTAAQGTALQAARVALDLAQRVGHKRAELNARVAAVSASFTLAKYRKCLDESAHLRNSIEQLGATRFLQHTLLFEAQVFHALGQLEKARETFEEGLEIAKKTGFAFYGPGISCAYALLKEDRREKADLMGMAERTIAAGCVGHNQFWAYASGVDIAFQLQDQSMLSKYIELLNAFPMNETVSWSTFHTLRGRALLRLLEAPKSSTLPEIISEAAALGEGLGMRHWLKAIPFADSSTR